MAPAKHSVSAFVKNKPFYFKTSISLQEMTPDMVRKWCFVRQNFNGIRTDTLFCQELWWDQNKQQFHTDKPVRIHRPGMIINGVGLRAPQDFKTFDIFQITNSVLRVQNEITVPDSTSLTDTSRLTR